MPDIQARSDDEAERLEAAARAPVLTAFRSSDDARCLLSPTTGA